MTMRFFVPCFSASLCLAVCLAAAAAPALAEERASARPATASTLILIEENDFFGGTDEHYTNGIKLSWVSGDLLRYAQDERLPDFVLPYLAVLPFVNDADEAPAEGADAPAEGSEAPTEGAPPQP